MDIKFEKSFLYDIEKIKEKKIKKRIELLITEVRKCSNFREIKSVKKLAGYKYYYRIRIGSYRVGIKYLDESESIIFIRCKHRKDIYKHFP
ncbi:MAG: type II toxin-antitoxin system RelE/ParE family toxin [Spirochaetota bacterium]